MGSSTLTSRLVNSKTGEVECEFCGKCNQYQLARIEEQHPLTREDAITQLSEICDTPARFTESCYKKLKKQEQNN